MLILGFFGIGKTTIKNERMADLTDMGLPSLSLLKDAVEKYDVVMADPSWERVFLESGLPFIAVVPSLDRKEEFLCNFKERAKKGLGGGNEKFCQVVGENWEPWIMHLRRYPHAELEKGEWLKDLISQLSGNHTD